MSSAVPSTESPPHEERLLVPWWIWVGVLGFALLLAAEIHLGYGGLRAWVPYAVAVPVALGLLVWLSRVRVAVSGGEQRVDDAHIPVGLLCSAEVLDPAAKRVALGPELDPLAFVVHRPWVRSAVLLRLDDPADPTPYWLISSRRPQRLVAALDLPVPST